MFTPVKVFKGENPVIPQREKVRNYLFSIAISKVR